MAHLLMLLCDADVARRQLSASQRGIPAVNVEDPAPWSGMANESGAWDKFRA